jgi:hypothetical protein
VAAIFTATAVKPIERLAGHMNFAQSDATGIAAGRTSRDIAIES